jgi:hypothetical protein
VTLADHERARELTARRREQRRRLRNRILLAAAIVVAFGLGIALGEALHDNPRSGGAQTSLRTIPPLTASGSR